MINNSFDHQFWWLHSLLTILCYSKVQKDRQTQIDKQTAVEREIEKEGPPVVNKKLQDLLLFLVIYYGP